MSSEEPEAGTTEPSELDVIGSDLPGGRSSSPDKRAKAEAKLFSLDYEGTSDSDLAAQNRKRDESTRHNFHRIFIWGLRVVGISLIVMFVVRVLHIILPESWNWLTSQSLQDIDRMLFSGAAGGLLTKYLEPILNGNKSQ